MARTSKRAIEARADAIVNLAIAGLQIPILATTGIWKQAVGIVTDNPFINEGAAVEQIRAYALAAGATVVS